MKKNSENLRGKYSCRTTFMYFVVRQNNLLTFLFNISHDITWMLVKDPLGLH